LILLFIFKLEFICADFCILPIPDTKLNDEIVLEISVLFVILLQVNIVSSDIASATHLEHIKAKL